MVMAERSRGPWVLPQRAWLWLASLALMLPAAWPYLVHYLDTTRGAATGFIGIDMPVYMANAREHFDAGSLSYGNPFSPFYDTPSIYFQPMTLLLGVVWRVTGLDPGLIFVGFGLVAAVVCVRVAIALYRKVVGLESWVHWSGLLMFVWGGGVIALAGFAFNTITGDAAALFRFDADGGWWFLNLGRNLVFPTEAFYHALFLGCILALVQTRFTTALLLAALLSSSHPFTGVQLLLVLAAWCFLERVFLQSDTVPHSFVLGSGVLLALHLGYYLLFLSQFPEHRAVMEQFAQPWVYQAKHFVPAYFLVGGLAFWRMRRLRLAQDVLGSSANRLLLTWFAVSFVLANHEFAMDPIQPAHFTRGYVWTPLFLLGAPVLMKLMATLWSSRRRVLGPLAVAAIVGLFIADNALWLATRTAPLGVYTTADQRELLSWMGAPELRGAVVLAEQPEIGYLATVYTPLRAWHSHLFNTPHGRERRQEARAFFQDGTFLDEWRGMRMLIVYDNEEASRAGLGVPADLEAATRFSNDRFTVVGVDPGPPQYRPHGDDDA
jgi:hypothetical protein